MRDVRPPAVAGSFYPGNSAVLRSTLMQLLDDARLRVPATTPEFSAALLKAVIVPHAGYIYSGSTAALAYALVERGRGRITRVVLLGPSHRVALRGVALPTSAAFATPLGELPVEDVAPDVRRLPGLVMDDTPHHWEHSVEVQVPFLQHVFGSGEGSGTGAVTLVPLVVGHARPDEVADILDAVWGGPETLIVVSSDLSHYHRYEQAQRRDAGTIAQILSLDATVQPDQACGAYPVNGLLVSARRHGLQPQLLGACNSGDTAGDRARVVGYAALAFSVREADHA